MALNLRARVLLLSLKIHKIFFSGSPRNFEIDKKRVRRILAVSSTAIGDTVMATPGIRSLRIGYPNAEIVWMVNHRYLGMFEGSPGIAEVIPAYNGFKRFFYQIALLKKKHFDMAVVFHGNEPETTPMLYLSGIPYIFKYPNDNSFNFLLENQSPIKTWDDFSHGIDARREIAELAGGGKVDRRMSVFIDADRVDQAIQLLQSVNIGKTDKVVAFQIGASTRSRCWSSAKYSDLARLIKKEFPLAKIVLTGSNTDQAEAMRIKEAVGANSVIDLCGKIDIRILGAVIKRFNLLISGDTGPMHVAVAVGTPVIALFAVSRWERSGPAYDFGKHVIIQKERTCRPCYSKRCPYFNPICMDQISVDEVYRAVSNELNGVSDSDYEQKN